MNWITIFDSVEKAEKAVPSQTSRLIKIGEHKICLINFNGEFKAINDRCPHQGAALSQGAVNYLGEVICPLHEYRFNSTTGQECGTKCDDAITYPIAQDEKGVRIQLR